MTRSALVSARMRGALLIAGAIAIVLVGCSFVVDTDGLAGGPLRDGGEEAGAVIADGGGTTNETGTVDSEAVPAKLCDGGHVFCDDFDDLDAALPGRWDSVTSEAGPLVLDPTVALSAPRSLRARAMPSTGERASALSKSLPVTGKRIRIAFDYRLDPQSEGSISEIDPFEVHLFPLPAGRSTNSFGLVNYKDGPGVEYARTNADGTPPTFTDFPIKAPNGQWLHVKVTIDYTVLPAQGSIDVEGDVRTFNLEGNTVDKVLLSIGAIYVSKSGVTWDFRFDNVVVDSP